MGILLLSAGLFAREVNRQHRSRKKLERKNGVAMRRLA